MKNVVITGSTRGIGFGLAEAFVARGCRVVISGRAQAAVDEAVGRLSGKAAPDQVFGHPCDVSDYAQVKALWEAAARRFSRVDIWINNAGAAQPAGKTWTIDPPVIKAIADTNLTGLINGCHVAVTAMIAQGGGQIYNMEGYGSDGSMRAEMATTIYGASKAAVRYFSRSLAKELAGTPVQIGTLSPGMVATDLVTGNYRDKPEEWARVRPILNVFTERTETVTPWLVDKMLANDKNGAWIQWLTKIRLFGYFALAPFRKRDVFGDILTP